VDLTKAQKSKDTDATSVREEKFSLDTFYNSPAIKQQLSLQEVNASAKLSDAYTTTQEELTSEGGLQ
jgi:hypothetical protein